MSIKVCKKCLMPSSRPRVIFNQSGLCNACINSSKKKRIDWVKRKKEFEVLLEKNKPSKGLYDCIVPWSGGKDSSMIALKLKEDYNLNPLLVTFSPMIPTEIGNYNREQLIQKGFDHIFVRPNQNVSRYLAKRFFIERGNPKVCWDAGVTATPLQIASQLEIPLVIYAEHGESEFGGKSLSKKHERERDINEFLEHLVGDDPFNWVDDFVDERNLAPYFFPDNNFIKKNKIKAVYFTYFFEWDILKNYEYVSERINFKTAPGNKSDGTFTNFDSLDDKIDNLYYYMQMIKFGFGRCVRDASRHIMYGHITRKEGLDFVKKYDKEFPNTYLGDVLDYLQLNKSELLYYIDKHRNTEIWKKTGNSWETSFDIK